FKEGHIEGAVNIPVSELESRLGELSRDKSIIVYCRSGSRSRSAADILVKNGFTQVYNMGGIVDWINSGYPVVGDE
ncbi:MAG: rhodanese-like domain-containing protein, partial [Nitrospira sp.]|nr:rhodanese-like domain-containing protein [Nitrospira sp.]